MNHDDHLSQMLLALEVPKPFLTHWAADSNNSKTSAADC